MTTNPRGEDFRVPTSADAARILQEITPVTRRSRRLARDVTFARPLLAWGLAWAVFLASVWAVGMLRYGIGVQDLPLAMVGLAILVVAAAARIAAPQRAMLIVGIAGGLGMAALGGWRMRWRR